MSLTTAAKKYSSMSSDGGRFSVPGVIYVDATKAVSASLWWWWWGKAVQEWGTGPLFDAARPLRTTQCARLFGAYPAL
jgi:hypothetical protein